MIKQRGISLMGVVFFMLFLGLIGIFGSQIGLAYMTKHTIQKAAKETLSELQVGENYSPQKIKDKFTRKFAGQINVDIDDKDISVTREGSRYVIELSIHKEVKITDEIRFCIDYNINESQ